MPRNNRPKGSKKNSSQDDEQDLDQLRYGVKKTVIKNGIEFTVQTHTGRTAEEGKKWICPHCHLTFGAGVSHIVAWESHGSTDKRRHFHTNCWDKFQDRLF